MKRLFLFILFFGVQYGVAQKISGTVVGKNTRESIPYANIGIVGKGIGTVSDLGGKFELAIPDEHLHDTLLFSCIGFKNKNIPVSQLLLNRNNLVIEMDENILQLNEITIRGDELKKVYLGSRATARFLISGLGVPNFGGEVGTKINVPQKGITLDSIHFYVVHNSLDTVVMRLNLYPIKGRFPKSSILNQNITITVKGRQKGWISSDISDFNIHLSEDVIACLELLKASNKKGSIYFSQAPPYLGSMYYRKTSHDKIKVYRGGPMGIGFTGS